MSQKPFRDQIKALEQLQELDIQIDQLKKNKTQLPAQLKTLEETLGKARTSLELKKTLVGETEKAQRQTRAALDLNTDRLARSATKLEGVQNSHEFQAVQKEMEQLRKLNSQLEEQFKKATDDIASGGTDIARLTETFDQAQKDRDAQAGLLKDQTEKFDGEIQRLLVERSKYTADVEKRVLGVYDRVRGARGGLGIAPAIGGRCKACNMMVPPQMFNEIQKGNDAHGCPSCHRLLFVPAQSG